MSRFRAISACLVACLAVLPLAPAAHVHETGHHDGSHGFLVHSHSGDHHHDGGHHAHDVTPTPQHDGVNLDVADDVVARLDPVFAVPDISKWTTMALADHGWPLAPPEPVTSAASPFVERQIHSPPRAPNTLRGPPSSSRP